MAVFRLPLSGPTLSGLLFLFLLPPHPVRAARTPELKFLDARDVASLGLRVDLMPDAVEVPQPPPTTPIYRASRGAETWEEERHLPRDLWISEQHAGQWRDDDGNVLKLAAILYPLPREFAHPHVTRKVFETAVNEIARDGTDWTTDRLKQWVSDYTGTRVVSASLDRRPPSRIETLIRFTLAGQSARQFAFAIRMRHYSVTRHRTGGRWVFAIIQAAPGVDPERASRNVYEDFLATLTVARIRADPDDGHSRSFQNGRRPGSALRSDAFETSRRQAVESIRNLDDWWYVETPNYIFLSDLSLKHRVMIRDLQTDIEQIRAAYEQFLPARVDIDAVSVVRVFSNGASYEQYVGAVHGWSGGLWVPSKKELVVKAIDWAGNREQREWIERVVRHEAFHQYLFYAMDKLPVSAWFNEGHAVFFENTQLRNRSLVAEEDERLAAVLDGMVAHGELPVAAMLRMPYTAFYAADETQRMQHYALAWGLVYYLRKAAPIERPARYRQVIERYLDALWAQRDPKRATEAAFEGQDIARFRDDFQAFWTSKSHRAAARRNRVFRAYRPTRRW